MKALLIVLLFVGYLGFVVSVLLAVLFREETSQIDWEELRKDRF
jgi:hypothetical protein